MSQQSNIPAKKACRSDTATNQRGASRYDYVPPERKFGEIDSGRKINTRFHQNRPHPIAEIKKFKEVNDFARFLSA